MKRSSVTFIILCIPIVMLNFYISYSIGYSFLKAAALSAQALMMFIAAKEDYLTGEVGIALLLSPVILFVLILPELYFIQGFFTATIFYLLYLKQKIGGADVIIFTELALLLGEGILAIMTLSAVIGLLPVIKTVSTKGFKDCLKQEIRFVPAIFLGFEIWILRLFFY